HDSDQPERDDHSGERKNAAKHCVEIRLRQTAYCSECVHWRTNCAPRNWSRVRNQVEDRCIERLEAKADHECTPNRHWCSEPGAPLDKCTKGKGDEQGLNAPVL